MKAAATNAKELYAPGRRLDASYHASEGVRALHFIHRWANNAQPWGTPDANVLRERPVASDTRRLDRLAEVCVPEGIFIGGRAKRIYVTDREHGIPFLSSSDMLLASFDGVKLISKKQPGLESMLLRKEWTLISRSGTIGNTAYTRADMDGLAGSEHILRVVPDTNKILPGYVYAYLSSSIGHVILKSGTFGSVVDTIEPEFVGSIPIPRLDPSIEQRIHELIEHAATLRVEANTELQVVRDDIVAVLGLPADFSAQYDHAYTIGSSYLKSRALRLDAYYYIGYAGEGVQAVQRTALPQQTLSNIVTEIFNPDIFKRIYVGPEGMPYLMGAEVYEVYPRASRFISRSTPDLERYVLREGMIIIQDAGQRYGLLGTPIYANRTLDGKAATNNMIRIVSSDKITAGYLFAFLDTDVGRRLIVRESYGSSLPHIFPPWLGTIPVPWPEEKIRNTLGRRVVIAFDKRAEANDLEDEAQSLLAEAIGLET